MANEVAKKEFTTPLSQWSTEITNLVARDYQECNVTFDEYSRKCAQAAVEKIYALVNASDKVKSMNDLDTSNLRSIVESNLESKEAATMRFCQSLARMLRRSIPIG